MLRCASDGAAVPADAGVEHLAAFALATSFQRKRFPLRCSPRSRRLPPSLECAGCRSRRRPSCRGRSAGRAWAAASRTHGTRAGGAGRHAGSAPAASGPTTRGRRPPPRRARPMADRRAHPSAGDRAHRTGRAPAPACSRRRGRRRTSGAAVRWPAASAAGVRTPASRQCRRARHCEPRRCSCGRPCRPARRAGHRPRAPGRRRSTPWLHRRRAGCRRARLAGPGPWRPGTCHRGSSPTVRCRWRATVRRFAPIQPQPPGHAMARWRECRASHIP